MHLEVYIKYILYFINKSFTTMAILISSLREAAASSDFLKKKERIKRERERERERESAKDKISISPLLKGIFGM